MPKIRNNCATHPLTKKMFLLVNEKGSEANLTTINRI